MSRGAGAVLAAAGAAVGAKLLHDPTGEAGLPGPTAPARLRDFFAGVDYPASAPRLSIATGRLASWTADETSAATTQTADETSAATVVDRLVRAAVAGLDPALGIRRFITAGDVVLIKPNVAFDRPPHLGATTHPEVVASLIRLCRQAGASRVLITDNPIESPRTCFARTGIQQAADREGAEVLLPAPRHFKPLALRDRRRDPGRITVLDGWPILHAPLAAATRLIGVAPVKDHNLTSASMAIKNWYGLLGGRRNQLHQAVHETISDLALAFSPTLVIADAIRVMMRNGPTGGRLSDLAPGGRLGRPAIVAAVDPVACDAWCYENLLGRDPDRLEYLSLAAEKIAADIADGQQRFGTASWRDYEQAGLIVATEL